MIRATIKKSAALLLGAVLVVGLASATYAQDKPVMDDEGFIFFINGANVQIPQLNGSVVADPLDPTSSNRVFLISYADWSESGFRWPSGGDRDSVGVDASAYTGMNYGETDTLYMKFLSDTSNRGKSDFIAFMDSDDDTNAPLDPDPFNENADLPFRLRWQIPADMHDGQWHEVAIPLPPSTKALLDSAKAGVDANGDSLEVEVDELFMGWNYAGAWAATSANGHWDESSPYWKEFDWEAVKYFGRHIDHADGGGPLYFDYFSIGVPPSELVDSAPAALSSISLSNADGVNTVSWTGASGVGGYNVYFSESEITDVVADGVVRLATVPFDGTLSVDHSITAPHSDLASDFEAYYAVTATSQFGSESAPAADMISADAKVEPSYAYELDTDGIDAVYEAIGDATIPDAATMASLFPEGYKPFTIDENRKYLENGNGLTVGDDDISAKFWLGFGSTDNELVIYAEVTDDALVFASETITTGAAWAYDSWELGLGNYTPESFIISSTHTEFWRGEDPDYQFRAGMRSDADPFVHESARDDVIPNSETIGETTDTGYRLLTLINTVELSTAEATASDELFDFPGSDEITLYPFNVAINDADDPAVTRETQLSWSNRAGGDTWWNTPARWQTIAFVGRNKVGISVEETADNPLEFSLDQNYPNPFNPTTKIAFTLASTTDVTLEVYNMLGQKVATLLQNQKMTAGKHYQNFDAGSLASGMYFYRISTPSFVQSRKMTLIK